MLEARYAQSLSGNKRSIKVQGGSIYVDCVPEELPAILEDLKPMVLQTNEEYRAEQVRLALQRETSEGTASAVKQRLEDVKKLLNFD